MGKPPRRRTVAQRRRFWLPTPVRSCFNKPPQPLGCGPLLEAWAGVQHEDADGDPEERGTALAGRGLGPTVGVVGTRATCCSGGAGCSHRGSWRFEVPSSLARRAAIGSNGGLPFMLQRVLKFSEVWFEPIPEPRTRDWLSLHPELMQTFDAFRGAFDEYRKQMGPTPERQCLHLLPLGPGEPEPMLFAQLRDICAAFFWPLRVAVLRMPDNIPESFEPDGSFDADEVLGWMASGLRSNSALTVALTEAPLRSGGVTTIGASDWAARVGVFSIQKYVPFSLPSAELDKAEEEVSEMESEQKPSEAKHRQTRDEEFLGVKRPHTHWQDGLPLAFERIVKLITHEAVHMFGVLHCCYFRCLMNGSSSIEEVDTKPPYLCGMCLKKLHVVLGFDPLERYSRLASAWAAAEREDIAKWYEARVVIVQSTLAGCRPSSQWPKPRAQSRASGSSMSRPHSSLSGGNAPMLRTAQRGAERAQSREGQYRSPSPTESGPTPTRGFTHSPPLLSSSHDAEQPPLRSFTPRPPETVKLDEKRRPAPNLWWSSAKRESGNRGQVAGSQRVSAGSPSDGEYSPPPPFQESRGRSFGQEESNYSFHDGSAVGDPPRSRGSQAARRGSISSALADMSLKEELQIQRKWDAIAEQKEKEAGKVTPSTRSRLSMKYVELESLPGRPVARHT